MKCIALRWLIKKGFSSTNCNSEIKSVLIVYFGMGSIFDPNRGDLVAGLGDITSEKFVEYLYEDLIKTEAGVMLLRDKPIISSSTVNLERLSKLQEDTLGYQYSKYMLNNSFSPDERSKTRLLRHDNPLLQSDMEYIILRYRQVHDFWHVLTGLPSSILGEVGLKWYEYKLTKFPVCLLSGIVGPIRLSLREQTILVTSILPWVYRSNTNITDLLSFRYEENLDVPVNILRNNLNLECAPKF